MARKEAGSAQKLEWGSASSSGRKWARSMVSAWEQGLGASSAAGSALPLGSMSDSVWAGGWEQALVAPLARMLAGATGEGAVLE